MDLEGYARDSAQFLKQWNIIKGGKQVAKSNFMLKKERQHFSHHVERIAEQKRCC